MKKSLILCFTIFYSLMFQNLLSQVSQEVLNGFEYRNIGPANQGGRIVDIEANENDFTHVVMATGSGGVWQSKNAGISWTPIFDNYETASIGDIALDQNNTSTIWVGTGEANNRNSVSWGNGIYKSIDGGTSFQHLGLSNTHQIARVLINPENSDDVCVCAIGHLWGYSGDRGLYRTLDGGRSWNKVKNGLPDDGKTGCTDLLQDPSNPNVMYAAMYHRLRQPHHFHSGGEEGGIYKSIDGGKSWKKLTNGLPLGDTGRIGLSMFKKNPEILMAIVEAKKTDSLDKPGSGVYRSENRGETWTYVNQYNNRPFYYSQIRINPSNDQKVYVLTTKFMVSNDGGRNFENGSKDQEVHGDFHAMWHDPNNENRYYLGADKGMSITHDHGENFQLFDNLPIAQYYRVNYDMRDPYYVYGGLQDNGSYAVSSFSRDARGILNDSNWKMHWGDGQDAAANPTDHTDMYTSMENGTYFKYNPDTREIRSISPGSLNTLNFGEVIDLEEKDRKSAVRFNWSAPLVMSHHNSAHIYIGGNYLYKSTNKGSSWKIISPDLSTNHKEKRIQGSSGGVTPDNTGAETYCSITSIAESPINPELIWVGTDDGNVQLTRDGGGNWQNLRSKIKGVPKELWVSRVEASKFDPGVVYVSFDGHRSDHFEPYIYTSNDYGKSWKKIINGIPSGECTRVIREDVRNPNLLFVGTETGVWFTLDRGKHWSRLKLNMPTVSVYDLKIHPRDNDLIVSTHGRSLWILDDISPLQQWDDVKNGSVHLFEQKEATLWNNLSRGGQRGHFLFMGENPKNIKNSSSKPRGAFENLVAINYFVGERGKDSLTLKITSVKKDFEKRIRVPGSYGVHRVYWDRSFEAKGLTEDDLIELDQILQQVVLDFGNSRVRRTYKKFKKLESSDEIRALIAPITGGYLSYDFDSKYLIPKGKEGTYILTIEEDDNKTESSVRIRKDPMNE